MYRLLNFTFPIESIQGFNKVRIHFQLIYVSDVYKISEKNIIPLNDKLFFPVLVL